MGALQKRVADGAWTPPTDPAQYRVLVDLDGVQVPVMSLSYEADAYDMLGRGDRARLLRALSSATHDERGIGAVAKDSRGVDWTSPCP